MTHSNDGVSQSVMKDKLLLSESKNVTVDSVLKQCGDFGRFQWFHYFFLNLLQISAGAVAFYYVYGAAEPEHRCRLPSSILQNDNQYNPVNSTLKSLIDKYIPISNGKWDKCHIWDSNRRLVDCPNGWVFDRHIYGFTFTEEAYLVCHTKGKKSWISTVMHIAGFTLLIVGPLADRFGRKTMIIFLTLTLFLICLLLQSLMQWVPMSIHVKFSLLVLNQFILGLTAPIGSLVFVLMLELTSYSYRSLVGTIAVTCFAFGEALATLFAYITKNWQNNLWSITIFIGLSSIYLYFINESPMYLHSKKKYIQLENVLRKISKRNGKKEDDWNSSLKELLNQEQINHVKIPFKEKILKLITNRILIQRFIITSIIAFTGMLLFIKISYGLAVMNISPYIAMTIGSIVEICGYISANIVMSGRLGRKYSFMMFTGLTSLCVFLIPLLTKRSTIGTVIISQFGKFSISASMAITWIYISELFPTSIRSSANGFAVAVSRIGAILAPVIDANIDEHYLSITFYIYAALALLVVLLTCLLPETKNVPLTDRIDSRNNQESIPPPSTQIQ
ncbi:unnamed protein product [Rotaria sp. Silwood1]|nr:unnamed protein product [Rotaria sp. Silwood1]CAF4954241.1 unnamed protein product [Rotaria sp. Silwood1]